MKSKNKSTINFPELFKAYRKAWIWVIVSVALCSLLGLYNILKRVPQVPVTAQIMITNSGGGSTFSSMSEMASIMGMSNSSFGSNRGVHEEMLVIGSHTLLVDVARQLKLNTQYKLTSRFKQIPIYENIPLTVSYNEAICDTLSSGITFDVNVNSNGKADIKIKIGAKHFRTDKNLTLPATVSLPMGDFTFATTDSHKPGEKLSESILVDSYDGAAIGLSQTVQIALASRKADMIELTYSTCDPEFGKRLLNLIMNTYRELTIKQQRTYFEYTLEFINNRIASLAKELNLAEGDIETFLGERDLVSPEVQSNIFISENYTQQKELIAAENEHELLRLAIEFLNTETNNTSLLPIMPAIASLTPLIEGYNELILERITIEPSARGDNVALKAINMRIDVVKDNLLTALNKHYEMAQVQIDELRRQFAESKAKLETLPGLEREYVNIKRQQALQEQLYLFLLRQREETSLNIAGAQPLGTIIDNAYVARPPFMPSAKMILLFFLLLGAVIPAIVILLRWKTNGKLNTIEQSVSKTGLQVITEIPLKALNSGISVVDDPETIGSQRLRLLRSNILSLPEAADGAVIGICSAEGKDTYSAEIAVNLAASLCTSARRTLIIDANIGNPQIASILQVDSYTSLEDAIITGNAGTPQPVTLRGIDTQLHLLAPKAGSTCVAADLFTNKNFEAVVKKLKTDYDFIVIALPSGVDFGALEAGAAVADIVIAEVILGRTPTEAATKIATLAGENREAFLAAITK